MSGMKTGKTMPVYYPVCLNLNGRRCVVVGGGRVALRKARTLLQHGASVEVISPELCAGLKELADKGKIAVLQRVFQMGDLENAFMAIAATDEGKTNHEVVREAREKAVLVNVADEPEDCDFIVPSCLRRGDITIAISTGGRSPALARKIRTSLEKDFGNEYAALALLIDKARSEIKRRGIKVDGDSWQNALDLDLLIGLLKKGDKEKAKAILLDNLKLRHR